jgi:hypothetical protein
MTSPLMITIPIDNEALQMEVTTYLADNATIACVNHAENTVTLAVHVTPSGAGSTVETARTIKKLLDMEKQLAAHRHEQRVKAESGSVVAFSDSAPLPMTSEQIICGLRSRHRSALYYPSRSNSMHYPTRRYNLKR